MAHKGGRNPKKIDREKFIKGWELFRRREINVEEFVKISGASYYLLGVRIREMLKNGYLPGTYFKDGLPVVLDFTSDVNAKVTVRDSYL